MTFYFRHPEPVDYLILNVLLQLAPIIAEGVARAVGTELGGADQELNWKVSWLLLGFAVANAPFFIRDYLDGVYLSIFRKAFFVAVGALLVMVVSFLPNGDASPFWKYAPLLPTLAIAVLIRFLNEIRKTKLRLRLLWIHQAQFAGFYCADLFGSFSKRGLRVSVEQPNIESTVPMNESEYLGYQFMIVSSPDVVKMRAHGHKVRALQVIVPEDCICFLVPNKSGIRTPADFAGKRIVYRENYEEGDILSALLAHHAIGMDQVVPVHTFEDAVRRLMAKEVDVIAVHSKCETVEVARAKLNFRLIRASDSGFEIFSDTIIAKDAYITKDYQAVEKFIEAVKEGWRIAKQRQDRGLSATLHFQGNWSKDNRETQTSMLANMMDVLDHSLLDPNPKLQEGVLRRQFGTRDEDWQGSIALIALTGVDVSKIKASDLYVA